MLVNILMPKAAGTPVQEEETEWSLGCGGGYCSFRDELLGASENWGHVLPPTAACPHSILRACNWIWQVVGGGDVNPSASWAPLAHYESCNCISDGRYQPVVVFYVMMLTLLWNYTLRMPQSRLIHTNSHLSEATHNLLVAMTRPVIVP